MDKISKYKSLAQQELEKRQPSLPLQANTKEDVLALLDIAGITVTDLDQALIKMAAEYIRLYNLTEEETDSVYEINAASLAALLVKLNLGPGSGG
jgi:hypothetical protein